MAETKQQKSVLGMDHLPSNQRDHYNDINMDTVAIALA